MLYFYFIPIFIGWGPWALNILLLSMWGEIYFFHAWQVLSLRPHSLPFQNPALGKVPLPGLCGNVGILGATSQSKVEKAASQSQVASLHAHAPRCSLAGRGEMGARFMGADQSGRGEGSALDKNSTRMNSCPPLLNDLSAD